MINIDRARCTGCGACVSDCVSGALVLRGQTAETTDGSCLRCGHCVAICPAAAVSLDDYDMGEVIPYDAASFTVDPGHFLNHVKFRRSIRSFADQPVEQDTLLRVIEAGRFTATGSNRQDLRFSVVQQRLGELKELVWEGWRRGAIAYQTKGLPNADRFLGYYEAYRQDPSRDRLFLNAPAAVVISAHSPVDGGLAAANMENMAVMEGLGVLYNGFIVLALGQSPEACRWLGLGNRSPVAVLLLGYPAVRYQRTVPRKAADIVWR